MPKRAGLRLIEGRTEKEEEGRQAIEEINIYQEGSNPYPAEELLGDVLEEVDGCLKEYEGEITLSVRTRPGIFIRDEAARKDEANE